MSGPSVGPMDFVYKRHALDCLISVVGFLGVHPVHFEMCRYTDNDDLQELTSGPTALKHRKSKMGNHPATCRDAFLKKRPLLISDYMQELYKFRERHSTMTSLMWWSLRHTLDSPQLKNLIYKEIHVM